MPCRLYLITPPEIVSLSAFAESLKAALGAGDVACLQLRMKLPDGVSASDDEIRRAADVIRPILRAADVHFLVNDRPDLAHAVGADGVHIGQSDATIAEARAVLGADATVGVTCHDSYHLAMEAGEAGADYVAFGAFFPTATKTPSARAEPDLLARWSLATVVPSVAIGGITPANCEPLVRAGADFLAVSGGVWNDEGGPARAVAAFAAIFARHE